MMKCELRAALVLLGLHIVQVAILWADKGQQYDPEYQDFCQYPVFSSHEPGLQTVTSAVSILYEDWYTSLLCHAPAIQ